MRLRLRLIYFLIAAYFKKRLGFLEESIMNLRVLPNDIDVRYITMDRYSSLMELGRMELAFRVGLFPAMLKNKWIPVGTFLTIHFRHPIRLFQKYELKTRVIWWDEKTFYFEQKFFLKGRVAAAGYVSATVLDSKGRIPTSRLLDMIGYPLVKPEEAPIIARLREFKKFIQ